MEPDKGQFNRARNPFPSFRASATYERHSRLAAAALIPAILASSIYSRPSYTALHFRYGERGITSEFTAPCSQAIRTSPDIYYLSDVWSA